MSLTEHCIFFVSTALFVQKLHDFLDFLGQLSESLHHIILIGKLIEDLLNHVSKLIQDGILEINQILLISLCW